MTQQCPHFDDAADFYEVLANADARLKKEGALLKACLEAAPTRDAADLACGTGLHAHYLAEAGARVKAFDLSRGMVAHAERLRPHPRVAYAVGDMRELTGGPYGLVVCLGNSLCLLWEEADLARCLRNAAAQLHPGGHFLIQIRNGRAAPNREPKQRIEQRRIEGGEVVAVKNLVPQPPRETLLSLAFFAFTPDGVRTAAEAAVLRDWSRTELDAAAQEAGLAAQACYGGFDRSSFNPDASGDLVMVLVKPAVE